MIFSRKKQVFVTSSPKSGSTFLTRLISEILGYSVDAVIAAFDRTEQDLFEPKLQKIIKQNCVIHQHTRATNRTLKLIDKYELKPIVLTRNIFDSVISMRNHIISEPHNTWWPMAYIDSSFYSLTLEKQLDLIIDLIVPWYINFYVSWHHESLKSDCNFIWITYEQLLSNKVDVVNQILQKSNIQKEVSKIDIQNAELLLKGKTRKSKETMDKIYLSDTQKQRILHLFDYYPEIDFKMYLR